MRPKILAFLLMLLSAATACDGIENELDGRRFLLDSADGFTPVDGTRLSLSFEGEQLSAHAGCNGFGGTYSVDSGRLRLGEQHTTLIACGGELGEQEHWFGVFLESKPRLRLRGDELELSADGVTLTFLDREVADPDRPLAGTKWTVDSYIEGNGVSAGPMLRAATLQFGADGSVLVDTTCNQGAGQYTVRGHTLTLTDMSYTEEGCSDTPGIEAKVQAVMKQGTIDFEIEARRLTLKRGSVGLSAMAQ